jgi:hypothetical protein
MHPKWSRRHGGPVESELHLGISDAPYLFIS